MILWRNLMICDDCWTKHNPGREPMRLRGLIDYKDCIVCENGTSSGIYIRVQVTIPD